MMDGQGVEAALVLPTLGVRVEHQLRDDIRAHAVRRGLTVLDPATVRTLCEITAPTFSVCESRSIPPAMPS
jgi:hypothetical protein